MTEVSLGVLPTDLLFEICKFIDLTDVIFSISRVCKLWHDDVCLILIRNFLPQHLSIAEFDDIFRTRHGRSFLRRLLRQNIMTLACKFYTSQQLMESYTVFSKPLSMESELERLKYYFGQFSDIRNGIKPPPLPETPSEIKEEAPKGILNQVFGFVASFFEKKKITTTNYSKSTLVGTNIFSQNPNPPYDVTFKIVLNGVWGVGKTSFLHCLGERETIDRPDYPSTIGLDFKMVTWCIGNEFKARSQVWDQCGNRHFRNTTRAYYRAAWFIFLMFDMTDRNSFEWIQTDFVKNVKPIIEEYGLDTEFIVVATKLDKADKRQVSTQEGEEFALNVVGGAPYVEITNKDWSYSHILTWYCSLFKYFIVVDKSNP